MNNTEKAVEPKMANRANASTHRKVVGQLTKQQQNRARQLVALVPKPGAKSDLDESESSGDELQYYAGPANSDSSSSPLSLPSLIENLHLLSDDDTETNDIACWCLRNKSLRKFERTKTSDIGRLSSNSIATIQKPVAERPPDAERYDQIGHYPKIIITRGRLIT
ncbi:hypothetical protein HW555_005945 [Spodoptera exigua]|uniref:Uncharacterized protein n=1 Tax=Spodoptera exigua TaxID=7107 RepID=A0A835L415_SPOEX|nr:hypothetical protein HW555_005945 [Spodoptera exigua]